MKKLLLFLFIGFSFASIIFYTLFVQQQTIANKVTFDVSEHCIELLSSLQEQLDIMQEEKAELEAQQLLLEANKKIIAIDPGHQAKGNYNTEPDGPGSSTTKAKVTTGTSGRFSGLAESELNLIVALKLQKILEADGHTVVMIRTTQDVDISNSERAQIANEAGADAFIRIHADGSDNSSAQGSMTICPTANNKYEIGSLYEECRLLSDLVLDAMVDETGFKKRSVWETDTMSGINWCEVPVTIVEMGFMTNQDEDLKMATDEYQNKFAQGMANGLYAYFDALEN